MLDRDVRSALHGRLLEEHSDDLDSTRFVDELCLCGEVRVDVAVVNAALSGFELKSASDNLRRLPLQIEVYSRVLDYCTIVVAEKHLEHAAPLLPMWWGCIAARWDGEKVSLDEIMRPTINPAVDGYALAQLLWRDEALAALEGFDAARGYRNKPRKLLWQRLSQVAEIEVLKTVVRTHLKDREGWRSTRASAQAGRAPSADDAASRPLPTSAASL